MATSSSESIGQTKKTAVFKESTTNYLKELVYNSEALEQHSIKDSQVEQAFTNFLRILSTPPLYTTLLVNSLAITRHDVIVQLQAEVSCKYAQPIETCPVVEEAIMIRGECKAQSVIGTDGTAHIVVDYRCGMSVLRGADVFVPGVIAISSVVKIGDLASVFCDVEGTCTMGMTGVNRKEHELVFVGNGLLKIGRSIFKGSVEKKGTAVEMVEPVYCAPPLNGLMTDKIYLQNIPSMLVTEALDPKPNEVILDMCAAPGGKTLHIALKMQDTGLVVALDNRQSRVNMLEGTIERFKLQCVKTFVFNSTKCCDLHRLTGIPENLSPPYPPDSFDRILLDAPCSGLGQRPQFCLKINLGELKAYPPYQKQFISQAVSLLKPGGTLVYSTCTINPLENEANVSWALSKWPQLKLVDVGVSFGNDGILGHGLGKDLVNKVRRFGPSLFDQHTMNPLEDSIGFFIAKFIKMCN